MTKGRFCGGGWARHCARYHQLKKMGAIDTEEFVKGWKERDCLDAAAYVVQVAEWPGYVDPRWCMFAEDIGMKKLSSFYGIHKDFLVDNITIYFVVGFIKGAMEVWEEVRDDVQDLTA